MKRLISVLATAALLASLVAFSATTVLAAPKNVAICPAGDSGKIDVVGNEPYVVIEATEGYEIYKVCVKAGTETIIIDENTPGGGLPATVYQLYAPNLKDISHYSYWERPITITDGEWCSPGFWKNHADAALFAASFDDPNAPLLPANWQDILASPNTYGGALFNYVGSVLSQLHPDVDFTLADPTVHSCLLSGRAN